MRCPNCQTELPKTATFCPKCGTPLHNQSAKNSQGQAGSSAPPSGSNAGAYPQNTSRAKDLAAEPTLIYNPAQPPTLRRKSTTGTQLNTPKQFMQTAAPSPLPASQAKAVQPPQPIPATSSSHSDNHPPMAGASGGNPARKLLLYAIVAVAIILLVVVIVLVSHAHTSLAPLHAGQYYALQAQGINYERNFTF